MSTVIGVHEIELKPGVSPAEFEQFAREQIVPAHNELHGSTTVVYKGERGVCAGHDLLVMTFESAAARDHIFPSIEYLSEDVQRWYDAHAALRQRWEQLATPPGGPGFTDYVEVA